MSHEMPPPDPNAATTPPPPQDAAPVPPPPYGSPVPPPPPGASMMAGGVPLGKVRSTGICILLMIVTFGIYGYVWWWLVHDELKRHTGQGLGGPLAFVIAFLISPVAAFLTADEAGKLYARRGQEPPVTAMTGLWYFPGILILVGPLVWFIKTNGAINNYWKSLGVPA